MWMRFEKQFFLSCQKMKWQTYQFAICIYKLLTYISTFLIIEEMAFVKQHLEKSTSFYYFCLLKLYFNASSYTKTEGHKEDLRSQMFLSLIEILWSNLTLEQNSSWIWFSAGNPMLVLSRPEYSELALKCQQKVKFRNYFAQVSNSITKFLSVLFLFCNGEETRQKRLSVFIAA